VTIRGAAGLLAILSAMAAPVAGCHRDGCVGGDDGTCIPPSACTALRVSCGALPGTLNVTRLGADFVRSGGPKARAAPDDILLENDLVRVVIDAPSHPSGLAPTGGAILDLAPTDTGFGDQINSIYQGAGLLPRDAVHYDSYQQFEEHGGQDPASAFVAVVFRGHLEGDERVTVVTRYELRACEPGVRVRTDLYNGGSDPNTLYLADGFFWGDNSMLPFVPGVGLGFRAPKLDLRDIATAWREWPFVAARSQAPPDVAYAIVPCDEPHGAGFNDATLTAAGVPLATTLPGDGIHYERFILVKPGGSPSNNLGLGPAVSEALRVRAMVQGEPQPLTVSGRVVAGGKPVEAQSGRAASLLFYEPAFGPDPDDPARITPWSEVVPRFDGSFSVALPTNRSYRARPYAFGLPAGPAVSFALATDDVDLGDITMTASAHVIATVTTVPGQVNPDPATYAELVFVPVERPAGTEVPSLYGLFPGCNPMLGPPHGPAPACNRVLTLNGVFDLLIPAGHYYVYATRGPFATLDRVEISLAPGDQTHLPFLVQSLPTLLPAGVVSGDFHVHGAASYDSAIPDKDRVIGFRAAGVDVIVASDHDVVTNYADALAMLPAQDRIIVIPGVEATPNIPWFVVPGEDLPKTLGHFNFWPLVFDDTLPRNGMPWDELREPGQMMDDIAPFFSHVGVRQLNHPFAESKLERDQGFLRAIGYDPRTAITPGASFAADVLLRTPGMPMGRRNLDWDVQEVMNGASPANWLRYRALWFSLLSQGIVRAGTANSDTHSLGLEQVGYPRNLVFRTLLDSETNYPDLRSDIGMERFDDDVRRGHMVGTNGPILNVTIDGVGPGVDPIQVSRSTAQISISVQMAPWIPVDEVRIIVNGEVTMTFTVPPPKTPIDHFGTQVVTIPSRILSLESVLPLTTDGRPVGDVWLIVEAGTALPAVTDVDGDGLPDLADGALPPAGSSDPVFDYQAIAPGSWPVAFTNPFLLDLDGDGHWRAPGLPP
jgi:hypothetical protein